MSIVIPFPTMWEYTPVKVPAMPAPSGLVRLQDQFDGFTEEVARLDHLVLDAMADQAITTEEVIAYRIQRESVYAHQQEIGQGLSFLSDALSLCKTILHTGAVTPWGARSAREKAADREQVLATVDNILLFPGTTPQQLA